VLLHVTSLPSPYGIGDVGPAAHAWIDQIHYAGQSWWQALPLGPTGYGNSPYQALSSFAGNGLLVSPDFLIDDGLLTAEDCEEGLTFPKDAVDFDRVIAFKHRLLARAWSNFRASPQRALRSEFDQFCSEQAHWLNDYALFRAMKMQYGGIDFLDWPQALVKRDPAALACVRLDQEEKIDQSRFAQFLLFRQGKRLKDYARERGILLIGDLPFFVSQDSSDVWANPECFQLDHLRPRFVAGVPPDYFSAQGQLWGNPVYDWEALRRTGYRWCIDRLKALLAHVDLVRLDHFRGFCAAWHVPPDARTAEHGHWVQGPGADFFEAVQRELGHLPFIAEDLGLITADVIALRDKFGLQKMVMVGDRGMITSARIAALNMMEDAVEARTKAELANEDLKWESTQQTDIGYDLSLFNSRIELSVDAYRKVTKNLLLNASLPASTGFATVFKNVGTLRNQGLEFSLNTINVKSKSFTWATNFNISFNINKIIALAQNQEALFAGTFIANNPWVSRIGQQSGMFYGYAFNGVYQYSDFDNPSPGVYILRKDRPDNGTARATIQPGDEKFKDINGDGTINAFDNVIIGRSQPIHIGGFSNNFNYKGFDLNVFFQWSYGNQILNADRFMFEGNGNKMNNMNQYAEYAHRWSPTNPSNTMYRAGGQGPLSVFSSRLVENGSYLRLKTVSLGYNLPLNLISKLSLTQLRFNVSAQNLLTFTKYSGRDPEVSVRNTVLTPGLDFSAYPQARSITFGLNASF